MDPREDTEADNAYSRLAPEQQDEFWRIVDEAAIATAAKIMGIDVDRLSHDVAEALKLEDK